MLRSGSAHGDDMSAFGVRRLAAALYRRQLGGGCAGNLPARAGSPRTGRLVAGGTTAPQSERIALAVFSTSSGVFMIPNARRANGTAYGVVDAMIFFSSSLSTTCCARIPFTSKQTIPAYIPSVRGV